MVEEKMIEKLSNSLRGMAKNIGADRPRRIFVEVSRDSLVDVAGILKDQYGGYHITTITVLDTDPDYEILYHIATDIGLVTLRVFVPKSDPGVETLTGVLPGAILYEREISEMMGINVKGHPDMRTLLLPDSWGEKGHPLRKDWVDPRIKGGDVE